MMCPRCQCEFRDGFVHCGDCDVDLVDDATPRDERLGTSPPLRCSSCGAVYIAGTTLCADCMGTDLRPIIPAWAPPEIRSRWRSTEGLRTALIWILLVLAVASTASAFAHAYRAHVIDRIGAQTATFGEAQDADELVGTTFFAQMAAVVAAGVVFLVWQWRTAKNAEVLGRTGARYGPGWSIGGWFIPLANLWIPVLVMQDLWRSSDPASLPESWRSRPRSALVGWWWATIIVGGLAGRAGGVTDTSSLSDLRSAEEAATFAAVVVAVTAVLSILVVRRLTARQVALRASIANSSFRAA